MIPYHQQQQQLSKPQPKEQASNEIPEHLLIRDVIYALQGIDGRFIKLKYKQEKVS